MARAEVPKASSRFAVYKRLPDVLFRLHRLFFPLLQLSYMAFAPTFARRFTSTAVSIVLCSDRSPYINPRIGVKLGAFTMLNAV